MVNELPIWLNQGVEPPESLKTTGWQPGMKPSAQHMNWLFNRIYLAINHLIENGDVSALEQLVNSLKQNLNNHLDDPMPHKFFDNGKWYRWGFRTVDGEPEFIYEEVL
ncbi:hypothetical protein FCT18_14815 [Lysinibacillus sphaericus]|uniref:Uncharacterized protein n=1 Tax=Lysinibacillus sphaericus TaxID=1421 RepID=A0A2S0K637_LYSSH|nr:hypothetical protein [Lysinibacillus sphaericus]AVK98832.1 hypothetical protein LS41612_22350 [Lysinibacillus sphaericus]MED4545307.1 hypothetical protein [Lysinibacillus sphaericus]TKI18366.1 hypothetical protein FCT18_14815 [Lysinibacillus sphaericus]SUV15152.1 Uncharacterised protein [Lysinibacillus sphaericus]